MGIALHDRGDCTDFIGRTSCLGGLCHGLTNNKTVVQLRPKSTTGSGFFIGVGPGLLYVGMIHQQTLLLFGVLCDLINSFVPLH